MMQIPLKVSQGWLFSKGFDDMRLSLRPPCASQIGPFWRVSDSLLGVKQAILLSSPGSATIKVPYTVTVTGDGPFASLSRWEWQGANTAPTLTANRKAGHPLRLPCSAQAMM